MSCIIQGYLQTIAEFQGKPSLSRMLLDNGRAWELVGQCPPNRQGPPRQCFRNSTLWAVADATVTYCEGYAVHGDVGFPAEHAWVVDRSGAVMDPTWEDGIEYFGLAFKATFLRRFLLTARTYGVLDDMRTVKRLVREPAHLRQSLAIRAMRRGKAIQ